MEAFTLEDKKKSVYYQLVQNESDFVGIIAYSIYKIDKIDFIENHKLTQQSSPEVTHLERFHEGKCDENEVKKYRTQAENHLSKFVNLLLKDKAEKIDDLIKLDRNELEKEKKNFEKKRNDMLNTSNKLKLREVDIDKRENVCKIKPDKGFLYYMYGVAQSLTATAILVLVGFLLIVFSKYDIDLSKIIIDKSLNSPNIEESSKTRHNMPISSIILDDMNSTPGTDLLAL